METTKQEQAREIYEALHELRMKAGEYGEDAIMGEEDADRVFDLISDAMDIVLGYCEKRNWHAL